MQPQLLALDSQQIAIQEANKQLAEANYATQTGLFAQSQEALKNSDAMGKAFDEANDDSSFYLPRSVRQLGVQAWAEALPVAGRQSRPDDHHP